VIFKKMVLFASGGIKFSWIGLRAKRRNMKAWIYSPGIVALEIMGVNFAMPKRLVLELIAVLQEVLKEMGVEDSA